MLHCLLHRNARLAVRHKIKTLEISVSEIQLVNCVSHDKTKEFQRSPSAADTRQKHGLALMTTDTWLPHMNYRQRGECFERHPVTRRLWMQLSRRVTTPSRVLVYRNNLLRYCIDEMSVSVEVLVSG